MTPTANPPVETPTPTPAAPPAAPAISKEEFEALKAQVEEGKRATQFWYEKANAKAEPAKKSDEEPEPDLLDLITTGGPKAFDAYMKKKGYVSRDEVESTVNSKAAQLSKENELMGRYPDLKKKDTDFFKATASYYGELIKQRVPEALAMELAAEKAELDGIKTGKLKTPTQQAEEAKAEKERQRLERIKAQGTDRGGRAPAADDEEDDELTPAQRTIAIRMLAGDGVTEEQAIEKYKARAKSGVRMTGKGTR